MSTKRIAIRVSPKRIPTLKQKPAVAVFGNISQLFQKLIQIWTEMIDASNWETESISFLLFDMRLIWDVMISVEDCLFGSFDSTRHGKHYVRCCRQPANTFVEERGTRAQKQSGFLDIFFGSNMMLIPCRFGGCGMEKFDDDLIWCIMIRYAPWKSMLFVPVWVMVFHQCCWEAVGSKIWFFIWESWWARRYAHTYIYIYGCALHVPGPPPHGMVSHT